MRYGGILRNIFLVIIFIGFISIILSKIISVKEISKKNTYNSKPEVTGQKKKYRNRIESRNRRKKVIEKRNLLVKKFLTLSFSQKTLFLQQNILVGSFVTKLADNFSNNKERRKFGYYLLNEIKKYKNNEISKSEIISSIIMLGKLYQKGFAEARRPLLELISQNKTEVKVVKTVLMVLPHKAFKNEFNLIFKLFSIDNQGILIKLAYLCKYYKEKKCIPILKEIGKDKRMEFGERNTTVLFIDDIVKFIGKD